MNADWTERTTINNNVSKPVSETTIEAKLSQKLVWFKVKYPNSCRYVFVDSHTYGLVWVNVCMFFWLHIALGYALYRLVREYEQVYLTWLFCIGYSYICGIGVTCGAHRLWTHRSYEASFPLRFFLVIAHCMAGQNDLYTWVRDHRVHHKFSETDADPHNSLRGMFFAHVGWLLTKKHPDVIIKGLTVDMRDVAADPLVRWQRKYYVPLYFMLRFWLPIYIPTKLWNEDLDRACWALFATYIMSLHITWFVNSIAHWWGSQTYNAKIQPRQNLFTSWITLGEGFHNFHHTFPWDYTIGEFEWNLDLGKRFIELCSKLGLAWNLKRASDEQIRKTREMVASSQWSTGKTQMYNTDHPYLFPHDYK